MPSAAGGTLQGLMAADQANYRDRSFQSAQAAQERQFQQRDQTLQADNAYREWQKIQAEQQAKQQAEVWAKNREKLDLELTGAREQSERNKALREEGFGPLIAAYFKGTPASEAKVLFDKKGKLRLNGYKWDDDQNALVIDVTDAESGEPAPVTIPEQVYAAVLKNGYGWDYRPVGASKQERQSTDVQRLSLAQRSLQEMATDIAAEEKAIEAAVKTADKGTMLRGADSFRGKEFKDRIAALDTLRADYNVQSALLREQIGSLSGTLQGRRKLKPMTDEIRKQIAEDAIKNAPAGKRKQFAIDLAVSKGYDPTI